ncbi:hypothetical protein RR46_11684 [Papilio xuthus]|uniref:Uncharacterized protein n=1 Tax=Papilio xuthus TaxID=66420 RepID=A0A194PR92_PAPXU|nr:hypothetical protein RR46_11684 [Papilio xuthus]
MHPTGAASLPAAPEAEVQAMHSMDWLFKKERIYLLAQFWQQVSVHGAGRDLGARAPSEAAGRGTDRWPPRMQSPRAKLHATVIRTRAAQGTEQINRKSPTDYQIPLMLN